jgi:glycosyltransferase involved in cell wall biosynthesis
MTRIVQIAPSIEPGSGVAGVADALEREFRERGVTVERFTATEAGRRPRRPPRSALGTRLRHVRDVVWFSTVGTARARRYLASRPDAVSICHNDAMVGDIYVNHGLLVVAMRTRGHYAWRMVRNPLHLFTAARDRIRYRGRIHRAIVALSDEEAKLLVETYGRIPASIRVIPNGVDLERFRPADAAEHAVARAELGLPDDRLVVVFIGHEFERKGLPVALAALLHAPGAILLVVGGTPEMIRHASGQAGRLGVAERVRFAGAHPDPVPFLRAADAFVLPSAYESYGLVVMEALAAGLPVVSTPVGIAPSVVVDGVNGFIVAPEPQAIAGRLDALHADAGLAARLGAAGPPRISEITWDRVVEALVL